MKLSVVVPMYNARNIVENLKDIVKSLKKFIDDFEIIVVNDGSSNNCYNDAKKFKDKHVKIVGYKKNSGKGNALKYGVRFAKGDHIAFLDEGGDLSASQLKNFLEILKDENGDIVIGSKRHSESNVRYPAIRRLMSRTYQTLNRILFNLKVKDTQVGIKLFKRDPFFK